jgi:hypothetical protein
MSFQSTSQFSPTQSSKKIDYINSVAIQQTIQIIELIVIFLHLIFPFPPYAIIKFD